MICPHVHFRDGKQGHKETIEHGLRVADMAGIDAVFDMPNTDPPITTKQDAIERLKKAYNYNSPVAYTLFMGMTADEKQIREAAQLHHEFFPRVIGLKMFAGRSVGNLAVIDENDQKKVYETLASEGYRGVLAVHCEKEALLKPELWNPAEPASHSLARPPEAEIASAEDQIKFASDAGYKGTLHICHASTPEAVQLAIKACITGKIEVSCAVTPQHCVLYTEMIPAGPEGLDYKVNPPLRDKKCAEEMLELLSMGLIDFVEPDHAPHSLKDKREPPYLSGFPVLPYIPHFVNLLKKQGFSETDINDLTHQNICRIFGMDIPNFNKKPNMNLHTEYPADVFKQVRECS